MCETNSFGPINTSLSLSLSLFYCPLYYIQRLALQNIVSRFTEFKLDTLFFGDKNLDNADDITIILAVHDYIKDSERF